MPGEVGLEGLNVGIFHHLVDFGDVLGLGNVEALHAFHDAHGLEIAFPVDVGGELGSLFHGVAIEGGLGITVLQLGVLTLGQAGFEGHHGLGQFVGALATHFVVAGQGEELGHQVHIAFADVLVVALVEEVVVAVTETEATLVSPGNAHFGIVLVCLTEDTEEDGVAALVHLQHLGPHIFTGLHAVDFLQVGHQRSDTLFLQLHAVHTDVVERSNLVGDGAGFVLVFADGVDDVVDVLQCVLGQHIEGTVAAVLGVEGVLGHPAAAGVLVEVVLQTGGGVKVVKVDARGELGFSGLVTTTGSDYCHSCNC